ncbi:MAG: hypothetical protein KZQ66_02410 [Candidatus Thiodiazotropha sp. (ex Lucinoma aequizonata)]|nr:hypothetical protein [Candidatus Thiodiazotropha sp. (ex Lucinoma aequizonata)]
MFESYRSDTSYSVFVQNSLQIKGSVRARWANQSDVESFPVASPVDQLFRHPYNIHSTFYGDYPMIESINTQNMAVFCDFENIALGVRGVREVNFMAFDIQQGIGAVTV